MRTSANKGLAVYSVEDTDRTQNEHEVTSEAPFPSLRIYLVYVQVRLQNLSHYLFSSSIIWQFTAIQCPPNLGLRG